MNLNELFQIQAKLDNRIVEEHNLHGVDLLDKNILALQVELGELANEWRGFKFWSKDQKARTFNRESCPDCLEKGYYRGNPPKDEKHGTHGLGNHWYYCEKCAGFLVIDRNPLLEEYVDCLHFILSVGLELELQELEGMDPDNVNNFREITYGFNCVFSDVAIIDSTVEAENEGYLGTDDLREAYHLLVNDFVRLGDLLGFTWHQIEQAYLDKNQVNHERQNNGY